MQTVSCLEHRADKSNITEGASGALLTSTCWRSENKQLPNAWQDHQGRSLINLKQQVWNSSQTDREIPNTHCFPFLFKLRGINRLLDGSPIILLFSPEQ